MPAEEVFIGLGSNIGDSATIVEQAIEVAEVGLALVGVRVTLDPAVHLREVEAGRASDVVLEHAALRRSDLIAVAAHRPHGIAEHLRGTTADAVLRHANVAILTVPADDDSHEIRE